MLKVKIGTTELVYDDLREIEEARILQLIALLRREHQQVCVLVTIEEYPVNLFLPAGACTGVGGGVHRELRPEEQRIVDVWEKHKLNNTNFNDGELIAFLKQLRRLLGR